MRKFELLGRDWISIQLNFDTSVYVCRHGRQDRCQRHRVKVRGRTRAFTRVRRVIRDRVLAGSAKDIESPNRPAAEKVFDVWTVMTVVRQSGSVIWSDHHVARPDFLPTNPFVPRLTLILQTN